MKARFLYFFFFLTIVSFVQTQESARDIERDGYQTKYLTPNQVDIWKFEGVKDETLIVHVVSREFDPILELVDKEERMLAEVDDVGSESRLAILLPHSGPYQVRIHAFKYHGGGNYSLLVERFSATPLSLGERTVGKFKRDGTAHFSLKVSPGQILSAEIVSPQLDRWEARDPKGNRISRMWQETFPVSQEGHHYWILHGQAGFNFSCTVREARMKELVSERNEEGKLGAGEMDVWNLNATRGQFGIIEVSKQGFLYSQFIHVTEKEAKKEAQKEVTEWREIQFFPVASKGNNLRFVVLLGRSGKYQLHLLAKSSATYTLRMFDPTVSISGESPKAGAIPVGGCAFYSLETVPGQLFQMSLNSEEFDPFLRLYDRQGRLLVENDDAGGNISSQIMVMIKEKGPCRLQVSSLGNGGGGKFVLSVQEKKIAEIKADERATGELGESGWDYWSFIGKQGESVILNVRSQEVDPYVEIYAPSGIMVGRDDNSGVENDCLMAVKLPETGQYILCVQSQKGRGKYVLRVIPAD